MARGEGVPRVLRSWGTPGQPCFFITLFFPSISFRLMIINVHFLRKRCNKLSILIDTEKKDVIKGFQENRIGGILQHFSYLCFLERSNGFSPLAVPRCHLVAGTMTSLEMVWLLPQATKVSLAISKMSTARAIASEMKQ